MADGQDELRSVNWNEIFGFSQVFKSFRMAIHPSKLLLALAAIALVCLTGWVLDRIWSIGDGNVQRDAITAHFYQTDEQYDEARRAWRDSRAEKAADEWERAFVQKRTLSHYMAEMGRKKIKVTGDFYTAFSKLVGEENAKDSDWEPPDREKLREYARKNWAGALDEAQDKFEEEVDRIKRLLKQAEENAEKEISALVIDKQDQARAELEKDLRRAKHALTARKMEFYRALAEIRGRGIFASLMDHGSKCFTNATLALCRGDIMGGLGDYQMHLRRRQQAAAAPAWPGTFPEATSGGLIYWALMACNGLCWLLDEHLIFALIFLLVSLAIWSLFGGAIHRIAALQAAREEKISIRQALRFSAGKFLSFFTAPLIPLLGILILGAMLVLGGFVLGNWWGPGALLIGLLFGLAILVGLAIAFGVIGLAGGFALMYPTIAVEGSDSFDAISRSFSYVFNKPWRALVYAVAAVAHGSLCYVFVRTFAFIALKSTHFFAKGGIFQGGETMPGAVDKLDVMWPAPTFASLHAPVPSEALSGMEYVGALLVAFWVYIVIGLLTAFVLSYASSAATVIYYLLRRKVDATDLDDVYIEEGEEEPLPAPQPEQPQPAEQAPAEDQPAEGEQEDQGEQDSDQQGDSQEKADQ